MAGIVFVVHLVVDTVTEVTVDVMPHIHMDMGHVDVVVSDS